jgi:hypothetical protein
MDLIIYKALGLILICRFYKIISLVSGYLSYKEWTLGRLYLFAINQKKSSILK